MKFLKFIRKYPFIFMLVISTVILTMIGLVGKNSIYSNYTISILKTPQLAVVFEGACEGKYPWMIKIDEKDEKNQVVQQYADNINSSFYSNNSGNNENAAKEAGNIPMGEGSSDITNGAGKGDDAQGENSVNKAAVTSAATKVDDKTEMTDKEEKSSNGKVDLSIDANKKANSLTDNSNVDNKPDQIKSSKEDADKSEVGNVAIASQGSDKSSSKDIDKDIDKDIEKEKGTKKTYKFQKVSQKYFDDALFIGDSRTVGLSEYSGWKNPTYYADVGLTIYDMFDRKIAEMDGKKVTIPEALQKHKFNKIYIMVGINELGRGTTKTFIAEYKKALAKIQKLQPNAIVFVEGIMEVSKEKSDTDPIFNNVNIKEKNDHIAMLADNKTIFYIDVNEAVTDETGNLPSNYTFDNIHLKAAYYKLWTGFLLQHGVKI